MQNQQKPNWLAIALVGVIVFLVLRGLGDKDGGGSDLGDVKTRAKTAMVEYVSGVGDDHIIAGEAILDGKITNANQLKEVMRAATTETKQKLEASIGALDNLNVPTEFKDNPRAVAEYMITKGKAYKSTVGR